MRTARSERGLSLVEATLILMTLAVLTATIAPAVMGYVDDARNVAAKKDAESIGSGILQMLKDTGSRCLRINGTTDCTKTNRVDLLVSAGADPVAISASAASITLPDSEAAIDATVNWIPSGNAVSSSQRDTIDEQLIVNGTTPYAAPDFTAGGGPRMKLGWRGGYLNGPITSDPWNTKYQVNTIFLTVATNAFDSTGGSPNQLQEGLRETAWLRDVLVLSAGRNQIVQTSFGGTAAGGATAGGDDVAYVISGATR
jgi:hypothetical protein